MTHFQPLTRERTLRLTEDLHEQLQELANTHDRSLSDEIRHALRVYVTLNHRDRQRRLQDAA